MALLMWVIFLHNAMMASSQHDHSNYVDYVGKYIDILKQKEAVNGFIVPQNCQSDASHESIKSPLQWNHSHGLDFTHVSKTGGNSFHQELRNIEESIGKKIDVDNFEKCYGWQIKPGAKRLVMIRSTADHVFSQFAECRDWGWGIKVTKDTKFPRSINVTEDYLSWLHNFLSLSEQEVGESVDYNCYDPRNFIARFLSCDDSSHGPHYPYPHHAHFPPPQLHQALSSLHGVDFLGVTDLYVESVCLAEVYITGTISGRCSCSQRKKEQFIPDNHVISHLPEEQLLHNEIERKVEKLADLDIIVYTQGLLRFLCDVRSAELYLLGNNPSQPDKQRLICPGTMEKLATKLSYLSLF